MLYTETESNNTGNAMSGNYYYEDDQKRIIRETLLDKKAQEWVE